MTISTRLVMAAILLLGTFAGVGCATAPAPTPTTTAAKPAATTAPATKAAEATPAKPAATASAKPAASASAKPAAGTDWKAEWDKTIAAAKQEGKVVVAGGPGDMYRNALMAFENAYPDIKLELTGVAGADFQPKVLAERSGGQYLWDISVHGAGSSILTFLPQGVLDPVKPIVVLPEAVDDSKWVGGFDSGWQDNARQYFYDFQGALVFTVYVNRSMVPESEFNSVDQLLDPKWKGRIASGDPRLSGAAAAHFPYLLYVKGEDWLRKLFQQDLVVIREGRQLVESVVRGQYPIALGTASSDIERFKQEGLLDQVKPVEPDKQAGAFLSSGFGNIMLFNKAPHPNAAKVYINWLLSKEGQTAWVEATNFNSRRLDVEGPAEYAPRPGMKYVDPGNTEALIEYKARSTAIAKEMIK